MRSEAWGPHAGALYKGRSAVMGWLAMAVTAGAMLFAASQHALPGGSEPRADSPPGSVVEVDPQDVRLLSERSPAP
jgi:zinc transporter ZupT